MSRLTRSTALLGLLFLTAALAACRKDEPSRPKQVPSPSSAARPSSSHNDAAGRDSAETREDTSTASADLLRYDEPIFPEGAGVVLLPVRLDEGDDDGPADESFVDKVASSRGGERPGEMGIANIIVVDKLTGASRAVLDRPALITNVELLSAAGTTEGEKANGDAERSIIYAIVDRDTDGDSALTARDEAGCYISDLAGNGLHRINDPGSSLRKWYIDGRSIYLRVVVDGDHDGSFDNDDREERILRYDMGGQGTASRIVSDSLATAMIAIAKKPMR